MIITDTVIRKGLWFLFRTDLGGGPAGVLLSIGMTVWQLPPPPAGASGEYASPRPDRTGGYAFPAAAKPVL